MELSNSIPFLVLMVFTMFKGFHSQNTPSKIISKALIDGRCYLAILIELNESKINSVEFSTRELPSSGPNSAKQIKVTTQSHRCPEGNNIFFPQDRREYARICIEFADENLVQLTDAERNLKKVLPTRSFQVNALINETSTPSTFWTDGTTLTACGLGRPIKGVNQRGAVTPPATGATARPTPTVRLTTPIGPTGRPTYGPLPRTKPIPPPYPYLKKKKSGMGYGGYGGGKKGGYRGKKGGGFGGGGGGNPMLMLMLMTNPMLMTQMMRNPFMAMLLLRGGMGGGMGGGFGGGYGGGYGKKKGYGGYYARDYVEQPMRQRDVAIAGEPMSSVMDVATELNLSLEKAPSDTFYLTWVRKAATMLPEFKQFSIIIDGYEPVTHTGERFPCPDDLATANKYCWLIPRSLHCNKTINAKVSATTINDFEESKDIVVSIPEETLWVKPDESPLAYDETSLDYEEYPDVDNSMAVNPLEMNPIAMAAMQRMGGMGAGMGGMPGMPVMSGMGMPGMSMMPGMGMTGMDNFNSYLQRGVQYDTANPILNYPQYGTGIMGTGAMGMSANPLANMATAAQPYYNTVGNGMGTDYSNYPNADTNDFNVETTVNNDDFPESDKDEIQQIIASMKNEEKAPTLAEPESVPETSDELWIEPGRMTVPKLIWKPQEYMIDSVERIRLNYTHINNKETVIVMEEAEIFRCEVEDGPAFCDSLGKLKKRGVHILTLYYKFYGQDWTKDNKIQIKFNHIPVKDMSLYGNDETLTTESPAIDPLSLRAIDASDDFDKVFLMWTIPKKFRPHIMQIKVSWRPMNSSSWKFVQHYPSRYYCPTRIGTLDDFCWDIKAKKSIQYQANVTVILSTEPIVMRSHNIKFEFESNVIEDVEENDVETETKIKKSMPKTEKFSVFVPNKKKNKIVVEIESIEDQNENEKIFVEEESTPVSTPMLNHYQISFGKRVKMGMKQRAKRTKVFALKNDFCLPVHYNIPNEHVKLYAELCTEDEVFCEGIEKSFEEGVSSACMALKPDWPVTRMSNHFAVFRAEGKDKHRHHKLHVTVHAPSKCSKAC